METVEFDPFNGQHGSLNPLDGVDADTMAALLRQLCELGEADLNAEDRAELGDQIEAIVPALIELRDGGHIRLNFGEVVSYGTRDGFIRLASDARLSPLSRAQCAAIRDRVIVQGVKALLGHL